MAISGGVVGFVKLVKYIAKTRKRTDEKLDAIASTLKDQHTKDFQEVKDTLLQFKGSIDLVTQKVEGLNDRADRTDKAIENINTNILTFKGAIDSTVGMVERHTERIKDNENDLDDHEARIFALELKPTEAKSRATKRKPKSKGKKVR